MREYTLPQLSLYFFVYGFFAWTIRAACIALKEGRFVNRGLLNLPLSVPGGITMTILLVALPPLDGHTVLQYLGAFVILGAVDLLAAQFVKSISHRSALSQWKGSNLSWQQEAVINVGESLMYLCLYLLVHPFLYIGMTLIPSWLITVLSLLLWAVLVLDYLGVRYALNKGSASFQAHTQNLGDRMSHRIWVRLEKAYPGVERSQPEKTEGRIFAQGICFDKLVWVFLVSSLLGAVIEMVYCRILGGTWMSRSSLLYGAFSVVWGFGAVILTVMLQPLAQKEDRKIFLAGFVAGGVYEYLCSVFTELLFGTVFWDYSDLPLNLGGRTNVLYCIFWGILSVVWVKVLYPPMDRGIEKIPPLLGKALTWVVVAFLFCNGLLTSGAMYRYSQRQIQPQPANIVEEYLDQHYGDARMEQRWPNMIVTDK